jgi:CheY-like chemotaxis protein
MHVLLVDDDDSLWRALARTIRLAGFEVEAFESAETLLARGVPERDVCLVLDVDLPGIDGILSNAQAAQRLLARNPPPLDHLAEILADIARKDRRAGEVIRRLRSLRRKEEFPAGGIAPRDPNQLRAKWRAGVRRAHHPRHDPH